MASPSLHDDEPLFILSGPPAMTPRTEEKLVVLTQDSELLATLHAVARGRRVAVVGAEADLAIDLLSDHGGVVVIDTAATASPILRLTERLKGQFPDLVLVVAGSTEDQSVLAEQIGSGVVYRFLHKPLSEQRVKLVHRCLMAAARRRARRYHGTRRDAARAGEASPPRCYKALWILSLLAALAAGALWLSQQQPASLHIRARHRFSRENPRRGLPRQSLPRKRQLRPQTRRRTGWPGMKIPEPLPAPEPAASAPAPAPVATQAPVPAPVNVTPSAAATQADPDAQFKQQQLADRLVAEARKAFAANNVDEGSRWMQAAQEAGVSEEDLDALAREAGRVRLVLRAETITRLSQQFNERLAQGKLVEPANDSAKFYLAQLKQTEAEHPATQLRRPIARRAPRGGGAQVRAHAGLRRRAPLAR